MIQHYFKIRQVGNSLGMLFIKFVRKKLGMKVGQNWKFTIVGNIVVMSPKIEQQELIKLNNIEEVAYEMVIQSIRNNKPIAPAAIYSYIEGNYNVKFGSKQLQRILDQGVLVVTPSQKLYPGPKSAYVLLKRMEED